MKNLKKSIINPNACTKDKGFNPCLLIYKNAGSKYLIEQEKKQFPTHVVISSDILTRYVFRADVAYDWNITLDDIINQTKMFKDDHLHQFTQRYGQLRYTYAPQPPTEFDTQTKGSEFCRRANYIDGLHVNSTFFLFLL